MKIWILNDYNYKKYLFFKDIAEKFSRESGIVVEIEIKNRENLWSSFFDFFEKPDQRLADIIEIPHQWTSLVTKLGLSLPMDVVVDDITNKIYPFLKKTMSYENSNKYFSIPLYFEIISLFYKRDMLSKIVDQKDMEHLKWNDFLCICDKLRKRYKNRDYYPLDNTNIAGYINSDEVLISVMNRTNGYFSDDYAGVNLHKDEVFSSIADFMELANKKYLPLFEENFFDINFIKRNLSSMAFSFRRDLMDINDMEVTRFPDIMRQNELGRSFNLMCFSGAKDMDDIKKFMSWFYTPENLSELAKAINVFSPFVSDSEKYLSKKEYSFYSELFYKLSMIPNAVVYPSFEIMLNDVLMDTANQIVNNSYDPDVLKDRLIEVKGFTEYLIYSY